MTGSNVFVVSHLQVRAGKLDAFKAGCRELIERMSREPKCAFLEVGFDGMKCITHEEYTDASGVLDHLRNVRAVMERNQEYADLIGVEIYGPAAELDMLREPLARFAPGFYAIEFRFER